MGNTIVITTEYIKKGLGVVTLNKNDIKSFQNIIENEIERNKKDSNQV